MSNEDYEVPQSSGIFDSLPYYDNDYEQDPSLKEKAEKLIAKEIKPREGLHPKVPPPITLFAVSYTLNLFGSRDWILFYRIILCYKLSSHV